MAISNSWTVEGSLTKNVKSGISRNGSKWVLRSISAYAGKDPEGNTKYEYVSFFAPPRDAEQIEQLEARTKLRLKGRPAAKAYINKDGEATTDLSINLDYENGWEIIERNDVQYDSSQAGTAYDDEPF